MHSHTHTRTHTYTQCSSKSSSVTSLAFPHLFTHSRPHPLIHGFSSNQVVDGNGAGLANAMCTVLTLNHDPWCPVQLREHNHWGGCQSQTLWRMNTSVWKLHYQQGHCQGQTLWKMNTSVWKLEQNIPSPCVKSKFCVLMLSFKHRYFCLAEVLNQYTIWPSEMELWQHIWV